MRRYPIPFSPAQMQNRLEHADAALTEIRSILLLIDVPDGRPWQLDRLTHRLIVDALNRAVQRLTRATLPFDE